MFPFKNLCSLYVVKVNISSGHPSWSFTALRKQQVKTNKQKQAKTKEEENKIKVGLVCYRREELVPNINL